MLNPSRRRCQDLPVLMGWFAPTPVAAPILNATAMLGRGRNRLRDFVCQPEPMEQRSTRRPGNLQSGMARGGRSTYKDWGTRNPSWPGIPGFHLEVAYIRADQRLPSMRILVRRRGGEPYIPLVAATVVADDHNRVIPLMPEFVRPQTDPSASADLPADEQKQDCERNASKRWIGLHVSDLVPYRPVFLGDDLCCCHPLCRLLLGHQADFLFVCKPTSHKCLQDFLLESLYHSTGWLRGRNAKRQIESHRYRWQSGVPVRDGGDAVTGTWIEFTIRSQQPDQPEPRQTYYNTFFTSLEVTPDNVAAIARVGRARWKNRERVLQLPGLPRLPPQAQLRPRLRRPRQPARGAQPARLRLA